jgi:hypothetical protein
MLAPPANEGITMNWAIAIGIIGIIAAILIGGR